MLNQQEALFSCQDLSICYGNQVALEDVSFAVMPGDYLCIVGSNGSGKSTLLKGILGLLPVKAGNMSWGAAVNSGMIGYLPQQTTAQKDFPASVWEVVLSGCINRKGKRPFYHRAEYALAEETMKKLKIAHLKRKSFRCLSGGQQQRVLLARALCATENLLFMDEPITGLDPSVTAELYQLLYTLNREDGLTIVMTSHDLETALTYANKILQLDQQMVFYGSVSEYRGSNAFQKLTGGEAVVSAARNS